MHKSNNAIDAIDATHWSIYAQVSEEEQGAVVETDSSGKKGFVPGRFLTKDKTARLTRANDPARGLIYCNRCCTERMPSKAGANGYVCGVCLSTDIRIVTEPTGDYAI